MRLKSLAKKTMKKKNNIKSKKPTTTLSQTSESSSDDVLIKFKTATRQPEKEEIESVVGQP